ncbi:MAG: hypothetical protein WKF34_01210 [Pyrinomonadaceae bacterium]
MSTFISIPFKTESAHGLTSVNGVAKFSSAGIVLEFESKLFGLISNGVKETRLPIGEILDIKFKKGVMRRFAKIEIRLKSFALLAEIPSSEGKLTLKLTPDDVGRAGETVFELQRVMTETARELPPTHTLVSSLFTKDEPRQTRPFDLP